MSFLLDTNVLSEARKGARADSGLRAWLELRLDHELFTSVLVIGEIRSGVERLRRRDEIAASKLDVWLDDLVTTYASRVLTIDIPVVDLWGRLGAPNPLPVIDGLLAATAMVHGLVIVTRNAADFERTGASILNPFAEGRRPP